MELIVSLKSKSMYNQVSSYVDGIVLGCLYSFYANNIFSNDEIDDLIEKTNRDNKKVFLLVNLVMHNEYRDEVKDFIKKYLDKNVYFVYQDLGILQILSELEISNRGIYNPITMITNYNDLLMYDELGVDAIGMSSEITIDDVAYTTTKSNKVFYLGFGYHPMYQTYRKLASLYKDYSGLDFSFENMSIKELNKDAILPFVENKFGSLVFRKGVISILEAIEKVNNAKYLYLDGIFLDEDKQIKVYETYSKVINNTISKEEGLNTISTLGLSISNKFMYEDSVYNPEDF